MSESHIRQAQHILKETGHYKGNVDGDFGAKTLLALQQSLVNDGYQVPPTPKGKYKTVCLTAGHGGSDNGAVNGNITESDIACDLRNIIKHYLEQAGISVITDGVARENAPLKQAVKLIKNADLAIDIHTNAFASERASGTEALADDKHKGICQAMCGAIADVLGTNIRGNDGGWKHQGSGQHHRLAYVRHGGIVLETFFISNPQELQAYLDKKWLLGKAIAEAIINYKG